MMPAVEETENTPHTAELSQKDAEEAAKVPARVSRAGGALERLRGRMRGIDVSGYQWINTAERPIDGPAGQSAVSPGPQPERRESRMMAQGTALSTLLRSATRQYSPTPELTPSTHKRPPAQTTGHPQRDALRKVVQGAQNQFPMQP